MTAAAAFVTLDPDQHALAVDVAHLDRSNSGNAQAGTVGDTECGAVLKQVVAVIRRATSPGASTVGSLREYGMRMSLRPDRAGRGCA